MSDTITNGLLDNAFDYDEFKEKVKSLYEDGRPTSGEDSDMPLLEFTNLNLNRMKRNEKTNKVKYEVEANLQKLSKKCYWLVLVEGWCGDVAENLPIIKKMADTTDNLELKLIFRDQNLGIMDQYLTNGGRSIPKLICLDQNNLEELGSWGPRPKPLQDYIEKMKAEKDPNQSKKDFVDTIHEGMHSWYAKDQSETLQEEFLYMIRHWQTV